MNEIYREINADNLCLIDQQKHDGILTELSARGLHSVIYIAWRKLTALLSMRHHVDSSAS